MVDEQTENKIEEEVPTEEKQEGEQDVTGDETAVYELGYNILPTVGDEKLPPAVGEIKSVLDKHGAGVIMEEFPTLTTLAYTMIKSIAGKKERFDSAYFGWVKFTLSIEKIIAVKEELDGSDNLLRFLIIKTVREDTRAPKRLFIPKLEEVKPKEPRIIKKPEAPEESAKKKGTISNEELDKTIDELVVE